MLLDANDSDLLETLWWDAAGKRSWTPLLLASTHGHVEAVKLLLNAGANVSHRNELGWDALWLAGAFLSILLCFCCLFHCRPSLFHCLCL